MINQPDAVNIHVETSDIISNNSSDGEIANEILKIAGSCKVVDWMKSLYHRFSWRKIHGWLPLHVEWTTYLETYA